MEVSVFYGYKAGKVTWISDFNLEIFSRPNFKMSLLRLGPVSCNKHLVSDYMLNCLSLVTISPSCRQHKFICICVHTLQGNKSFTGPVFVVKYYVPHLLLQSFMCSHHIYVSYRLLQRTFVIKQNIFLWVRVLQDFIVSEICVMKQTLLRVLKIIYFCKSYNSIHLRIIDCYNECKGFC